MGFGKFVPVSLNSACRFCMDRSFAVRGSKNRVAEKDQLRLACVITLPTLGPKSSCHQEHFSLLAARYRVCPASEGFAWHERSLLLVSAGFVYIPLICGDREKGYQRTRSGVSEYWGADKAAGYCRAVQVTHICLFVGVAARDWSRASIFCLA